MKCHVGKKPLGKTDAPAAAVFCYEKSGPAGLNGGSPALRAAAVLAAADGFRGKEGETFVLRQKGGKFSERLIFTGLGPEKEVTLESLRVAASKAGAQAERLQQKRLAVQLPAIGATHPSEVAQAAAEGLLLGAYRFRRYKTEPEEGGRLTSADLIPASPEDERAVRAGIDRAHIVSAATCFVRDLVNEPAETVTPTHLAEQAAALGKEKGYAVTIHGREDLERLGMGGILGVARGSEQPPVFIELRHTPKAPPTKSVAFVGKGVTFDSGGLDIKSADGMVTMKDDMSGAANILGIFHALADLDPACTVIGLIPSAENMPSGKSYRPGDVLRMYSGKTVEIENTDAEGRLLLADGLWYGHEQRPDEMIDMATLTGAARQALGDDISAILGTDPALVDRLIAAGRRAGEKLWPLPLEESYWSGFRSTIADMRNTGKAGGGTIKAALFLKRFVGSTPWAHLDIASTAFRDDARAYLPAGGTGVMVRTMLEYLAPPLWAKPLAGLA